MLGEPVEVPAFCPAGQAPSLWFYWDVESSSLAPCPSDVVPTSWCLNGPTSLLGAYATSGVKSYWGYNRSSEGLMGLTINPGGTLPANARLQFNHSFGFDNGIFSAWDGNFYDGGFVEYSVDGGGTWFDAGSKITAGQAYGGTIRTGFLNPREGFSAFVADTWGYTASQLDLSSLAGQTVSYLFLIATSYTGWDYGWWVDDFVVYTCAGCIASRVLNATYNGLASFYGASASIQAGAGFRVGALESVTLEAPLVQVNDGLEVLGDLTIGNGTCP